MDLDKARLSRDEQKSDGKRFSFLSSLGKNVDAMLQKVNGIMHDIDEAKPYTIDFSLVEREYLKVGVGDIDEFSSNHAFSLSLIGDFADNKPAQQACYEEIRDHLWAKKKKGEVA